MLRPELRQSPPACILQLSRNFIDPSAMAEFNARLLDSPRGFEVDRAKFLNSVESYSNVASGVAREVLQAVFFAPRGSPASIIRKEIAPKIDAIHKMFKLDVVKALIDKNHPVGKEDEWPVGGDQLRFSLAGV